MQWIRKRVLERQLLAGTFLNLGSSLTAEIAARAGFDWLLLDLEHGSGDRQQVLAQLQAAGGSGAAPIVRIGANDSTLAKRILDLGPSGIMVPLVSTREEAESAVTSMLYPPLGVRGVASFNRACGFGEDFESYFANANENLLAVVQIETARAVANVEEIARVERVDVLFVGPTDLSVSMGIPRQFEHPELRAALQRVVKAARAAGKAAGILVSGADQVARHVEEGFTFLACGSDGSAVARGLREFAGAFSPYRS